MERQNLIAVMVQRLQEVLVEESVETMIQADPASPLLGPDAVISSLALVSYILDIEALVAEHFDDAEVTLVSESALSRRNSPFRTIETLADYVFELLGVPVQDEAKIPVEA
jgi:hypothetical protein